MDFFWNIYPVLGLESIIFTFLAALTVYGAGLFLYKKGFITFSWRISFAVMIFYILLVLSYTVFARKTAADYQYQLVPFWSYWEIIHGNRSLLEEDFWNIIMLMPVGILLKISIPRIRLKKIIIVNFAFSSAIEILQFILKKGLFEFDDIFHNTLGGIIGWAVVVLILRIKSRKA